MISVCLSSAYDVTDSRLSGLSETNAKWPFLSEFVIISSFPVIRESAPFLFNHSYISFNYSATIFPCVGFYPRCDVIIFYTEGRTTDRVKVTLSWGEPIRYSDRLTPELPEGVPVELPPGIRWKHYASLMSQKQGFKRKTKEELIFNKCKRPFQPEMVNKYVRKRLRLPLRELQARDLWQVRKYNITFLWSFILYIVRTRICLFSVKWGHLWVWLRVKTWFS